MSKRFFRYLEKVYGFSRVAGKIRDHRKDAQVSTFSCFMFAFWMFALGVRSLNAFEERIGQDGRMLIWKRVFKSRAPSADTVGYAFERLDLDGLRNMLHHIYTTLQRNHVIGKLLICGWRTLAIDGHELFASYTRHCEGCCERTVHFKEEDRIQYYYKVVVAQLVGGLLALPLDVEPVLPGEDEIAAALRLLERMIKNYPKAFDIVTGDALYANTRILKMLNRHNKRLVAVLKENHPDLLEDAKALFTNEKPIRSHEGNTELERWDIQGFNTWPQAEGQMRVVRSRETKTKGKKIKESDWFWVTDIEQEMASTQTICRFGHARWEIENQGFNYMVNYLHMNHIFHHHPTAIPAFILICLITYILLQAFHQLNLKHQLRSRLSLYCIIHELGVSLWTELLTIRCEARAPPQP